MWKSHGSQSCDTPSPPESVVQSSLVELPWAVPNLKISVFSELNYYYLIFERKL